MELENYGSDRWYTVLILYELLGFFLFHNCCADKGEGEGESEMLGIFVFEILIFKGSGDSFNPVKMEVPLGDFLWSIITNN